MEKYEPEKYDYYFDCGVCRVADGVTEYYAGDGKLAKTDIDVVPDIIAV